MSIKIMVTVVLYSVLVSLIAFLVSKKVSKTDTQNTQNNMPTVVDGRKRKDMIEDDILNHLQLQRQACEDMVNSDYIKEELGDEDVQKMINVFNLALGLHYLSVVTLEQLSAITEAKVAIFIRDSFESFDTYGRTKEDDASENHD